jgi:uncharacterized protein YutE (UPF0331/DUF86 family)
MNQEKKERLVRHLNFIEEELKDFVQFKKLTREEYLRDRDKRRSVERWVENLINSTVDISRMILIMANYGAATESRPYKTIEKECRGKGAVSVPAPLQFLS